MHIVEVPVSDFRITMVDCKKRSAADRNYCNAGYFGVFKGSNGNFTLPVGHLVCDFDAPAETKKYCSERGKFNGKKYTFNATSFFYANQFYGKALSTLMISGGKAKIAEIKDPSGYDYAITGVPIMRGGNDVKFATDVKNQGWDGSVLYGTWHIFAGLKSDASKVYMIGMKTCTSNMVTSAEAYQKFKALGFIDVIKLDGGGSFVLNIYDKFITGTSENRRINTIITFCAPDKNPYPVPTVAVQFRSKNKNDVKWVQWQLNSLGFTCDVDGSFGPTTRNQVKAFQKSARLVQDGSVGPATRAALLK